MDFSPPRRQQISEPILPMINVVFLLLVFFLLTTQIAPRAPFEVTPPATTVETGATPAPVLFVSTDGELYFQGETGEAAYQAISGAIAEGETLTVRADAQADAGQIVGIISSLRALGVDKVQLAGRPQ